MYKDDQYSSFINCIYFLQTKAISNIINILREKKSFLQIQNGFFAKPFASAEELNTPMNVK